MADIACCRHHIFPSPVRISLTDIRTFLLTWQLGPNYPRTMCASSQYRSAVERTVTCSPLLSRVTISTVYFDDMASAYWIAHDTRHAAVDVEELHSETDDISSITSYSFTCSCTSSPIVGIHWRVWNTMVVSVGSKNDLQKFLRTCEVSGNEVRRHAFHILPYFFYNSLEYLCQAYIRQRPDRQKNAILTHCTVPYVLHTIFQFWICLVSVSLPDCSLWL